MLAFKKKFVVDENGAPQEVIIDWKDFRLIAEMLGLDLDDGAMADLRQGRHDRAQNNREAYLDLNAIP